MAARLEGRWALVTGSGRGAGIDIARRFAAEGANVVVHYNESRSGAMELSEEIRALGRESFVVQGDTTSWEDDKRIAAEVFERAGRLDILVNNVGDVAGEQASWKELSEELVDRVIAVDIKGTLYMTQEVGRRMLEQGGGVIVNVCSNVVVTGSARAPQYAAAKYGVLGLTKSYARAFAPTVRVNAYGPGFMETEKLKARPGWDERRAQVVEGTPLERLTTPEEMSGMAVFLASDDSSFMTGNFVLCDGGAGMIGA
jgi:3-oxoacyl-[acyl-carrier protein] reductase